MQTPQTVLITGASSGIGRELAKLFARDGHDLVLVARGQEALESLRDELVRRYGQGAGTSVRVMVADLSRLSEADRVHEELTREGVAIDVLVNNAGFGMQGAFIELPLDRQLEMMTLNMATLTTLTRLMLPDMVRRRRGGVLNVGSTAAFQPGPFMAVYYATKAYVVSFSEAIADELEGTGVVVSCLCPGPTATKFADAAGASSSRLFQGETMTAAEVAQIGYDGFKAGKPLVIAGRRNRFMQLMVGVLPRKVVRKSVRRLNQEA